ncbi:hypothetical protein [Parapedobacter tibetensis]|uniref:hypothetical protein n=1 Tax=Parapedobacter tibetensis TaxID=2972951 RepID=UPI00214D5870|nr:hypothetical protein [Parapedobacter tibetensis]
MAVLIPSLKFTIPVDGDRKELRFELEVEDLEGNKTASGPLWLGMQTSQAK